MKLLRLVLGLMMPLLCHAQTISKGMGETSIFLEINEKSKQVYQFSESTSSNTPIALGAVCTLKLLGAAQKTFECDTCEIVKSRFYYSIRESVSTLRAFTSFSLGDLSILSTQKCLISGDKLWTNEHENIDLLSNLSAGFYEFIAYTEADYDSCGVGTIKADNSGKYFVFSFSILDKPTIVAPKKEICSGEKLKLTTTCLSGTPIWQDGNTDTEREVSPEQTTSYSVKCISSNCESQLSDVFKVEVNTLAISQQPSSQYDCEPNSIKLITSAVSSSAGSLAYQWFRKLPSETSFMPINTFGAIQINNNLLQISPTGSPNISGTQFFVRIKDSKSCEISSSIATITLNNVGTIVNDAVCEKSVHELFLQIPPDALANIKSYQWERYTNNTWEVLKDGGVYAGVNEQKLRFSSVLLSQDGEKYRCKVTFGVSDFNDNDGTQNQGINVVCPKISAEVALKIRPIPNIPIINTATPITKCAGDEIRLNSTGCAAEGGITYWYESASKVYSGAIYTFNSTEVGTKTYRASCIKNTCESVLSSGVEVIINPIPAAPKINITPNSAVICQGEALTLRVFKDALDNKVRWYRQAVAGTSVAGSTATTTNYYDYKVKSSDIIPSNASEIAKFDFWVEQETKAGCISTRTQASVQVKPPTIITKQPTSIETCEKRNVALKVEATGINLHYQWKKAGVNVGTDNPILFFDAVGLTDSGTYTCTISGDCGEVISESAKIMVFSSPVQITDQSSSKEFCENTKNITLDIKATGENLTFRWFKNNQLLDSTRQSIYFETLKMEHSAIYYCEVSSKCETKTSLPINLIVYPIPPIPQSDSVISFCQFSGKKSLNISPIGQNHLVWYKNNVKNDFFSIDTPIHDTDVKGDFYYYISQKSLFGCESNIIQVRVRVNETPAAPITETPVNLCKYSPTDFLRAVAQNDNLLHWYDEAEEKLTVTPKPDSTKVGEQRFFVSQSNNFGCESSKSPVLVMVEELPQKPLILKNFTKKIFCTTDIEEKLAFTCDAYSKPYFRINEGAWNQDSLITFQPIYYSNGVAIKYDLVCISAKSCQSEILSTELKVYQMPIKPTILGNKGLCQDGTNVFSVNNCQGVLRWNDNLVSDTIVASKSGSYWAICDNNSCVSRSDSLYITVLPKLTSGSIKPSSLSWNCSGYNPSVISSLGAAMGGKLPYVYSWESSMDGNVYQTISGQNGLSYDPSGLSQTIHYRRKVVDACGHWAYSNVHSVLVVADPKVEIDHIRMQQCDSSELKLKLRIIERGTGVCETVWKWSHSSSMSNAMVLGSGDSLSVMLLNPGTVSETRYYQGSYDCNVSSCNKAYSNIVKVDISPALTIPTISGGKELCFGGSVILRGSQCSGELEWSTGVKGDSLEVKRAGMYRLLCRNQCGKVRFSDWFEVKEVSVPTFSLSGGGVYCSGVKVLLKSSGCSGGRVLWSNGMEGTEILVKSEDVGIYTANCLVGSCSWLSQDSLRVSLTQPYSFTLESEGSLCLGSEELGIRVKGLKGLGQRYWLESEWTDSTVSVLSDSIFSIRFRKLPGVGTHSLWFKMGDSSCVSVSKLNWTVLDSLSSGSIKLSSLSWNCSGYNPSVISSLGVAMGGKLPYIYSWESSMDGNVYQTISGQSGLSYDPAGLSQTIHYRRKVTDACGHWAYSNVHSVLVVADPKVEIEPIRMQQCDSSELKLKLRIIERGTGVCETVWKWSHSSSMSNAMVLGSGDSLSVMLLNPGIVSETRYYQGSYDCNVSSCNKAYSNIVKVDISPALTIPTISGGKELCFGGSVILQGSQCNGELEWSTGVKGDSLEVKRAGMYRLLCRNQCGKVRFSDWFEVKEVSAPTFSLSGGGVYCSGVKVLLKSSGCSGGRVLWSNGMEGTEILVKSEDVGIYTANCLVGSCSWLSQDSLRVSLTQPYSFTLESEGSLCLGSEELGIRVKGLKGLGQRYWLESEWTDSTVSVLSDSIFSIRFRKLPGVGTHSLWFKMGDSSCVSVSKLNWTVLDSLSSGSIKLSSLSWNCSGYNPSVISSLGVAMGGKLPYIYSWESSMDGNVYQTISGQSGLSYDPAGLSQTIHYRRKVTDACGHWAYSNVHSVLVVADPKVEIEPIRMQQCDSSELKLKLRIIERGTGVCETVWKWSHSSSMSNAMVLGSGDSLSVMLLNPGIVSETRYYQGSYDCNVSSCNKAYSNIVKVDISPALTIPTISGGKELCFGGSVILQGSQCNGELEWSTGVKGDSLEVKRAGMYRLLCRNQCGKVRFSDWFEVKEVSAPTFSLSGGGVYCSGVKVLLKSSGCSGGRVLWSNGMEGTEVLVKSEDMGIYTANCLVGSCSWLSRDSLRVSLTQPYSFTLESEGSICLGSEDLGIRVKGLKGLGQRYWLESEWTDSTVSVLSDSIFSIRFLKLPGAGTHSLWFKMGYSSCVSVSKLNWTVLDSLSSGSIKPSSLSWNCSGYNPSVISSLGVAMGGKTPYVYSWESSMDGNVYQTISGQSGLSYDPSGLSQTIHYRRKVTDACGHWAYSNVHSVLVVADPKVEIEPISMQQCDSSELKLKLRIIERGTGVCETVWKWSHSSSMSNAMVLGSGDSLSVLLLNPGTVSETRYYQGSYDCNVSSCNKAYSNIVKVDISPALTIPTISGGKELCFGGSVILRGSQCNGELEWSTGVKGDSLEVKRAGMYRLLCRNQCGKVRFSDWFEVKEVFAPTFSLSGGGVYCSGVKVLLKSSGCSGGRVLWSNGMEGTEILVKSEDVGIYTANCLVGSCSWLSRDSLRVSLTQPYSFSLESEGSLCLGSEVLGIRVKGLKGLGQRYWLESEWTDSTVSVLSDSILSIRFRKLPGAGTHSLWFKMGDSSCVSVSKLNWTVLDSLSSGSIKPSSLSWNCSGYNPSVISSLGVAMGGKSPYVYSWESSTDGNIYQTISGQSGLSYDPSGLSQTIHYRRKVVDACGHWAYSNVHSVLVVADPKVEIDPIRMQQCDSSELKLKLRIIERGTGVCETVWKWSHSSSMSNAMVLGIGDSLSVMLLNPGTVSETRYYQGSYDCNVSSCNKAYSNIVKVDISPALTIPTISGGKELCFGGSVILRGSQCSGELEWSTGVKGDILEVKRAGMYRLLCRNQCGKVRFSDWFEVKEVSSPTLTSPVITGDSVICEGESLILLANGCTANIIWNNGMKGDSIIIKPSQSGIYKAICSNGVCTSAESKAFAVTVNKRPNILSQPMTQQDCYGNSVTFSVKAIDVTKYTWQIKSSDSTFIDIEDSDSKDLKLLKIGTNNWVNHSVFRVRLSHSSCETYSNQASLLVNSINGIVADKQVCEGNSVSISIQEFLPEGQIQTYQWQKRIKNADTWQAIPNQTTDSLILNSISNSDNAFYRCKITFKSGTSTCSRYTNENDSDGVKISVITNQKPIISGINQACLGNSIDLKVNACSGKVLWSSGDTISNLKVKILKDTIFSVTCTQPICNFIRQSDVFEVRAISINQPNNLTRNVIYPDTLFFNVGKTLDTYEIRWYDKNSSVSYKNSPLFFTNIGTYHYWVSQFDKTTSCESKKIEVIASVLPNFRIIQNPVNQIDCKGNGVSFSIIAQAPSLSISYQWQRKRPNDSTFIDINSESGGVKNWNQKNLSVTGIGNVNNPHLTLYRCKVFFADSVLISSPAQLLVNSISGSLPNISICMGNDTVINLNHYFKMQGKISDFQWQYRLNSSENWRNLSDSVNRLGTKDAILRFSSVQKLNENYYRCVVTYDSAMVSCSVSTDAFQLKVNSLPNSLPRQIQDFCQFETATKLKINTNEKNIYWYDSTFAFISKNIAPSPTTNQAGVIRYYVSAVTNEGCESPKSEFLVNIRPKPILPLNTTPISVKEGELLTFSASITEAGSELRWYNSEKSNTFTLIPPTFTKSGNYSRFVSQVSMYNCVGPKLKINSQIISALKFTKQPISQTDCSGNSVTFTVSAVNSSTFTYQWQLKLPSDSIFHNLPNEIGKSLNLEKIGSATFPHLSQVRCLIQDEDDLVYSESANLYVNDLEGSFKKTSICDGIASSLSPIDLSIRGEVALYQWQRRVGSAYEDISTTDLGNAKATEAGTYRLKVVFKNDAKSTCTRYSETLKVQKATSPESPQMPDQLICFHEKLNISEAFELDSAKFIISPQIDWKYLGTKQYFIAAISPEACTSELDTFSLTILSTPPIPIVKDTSFLKNTLSDTLKAFHESNTILKWYLSSEDGFSLDKAPIPSTKTIGVQEYFVASQDASGCESNKAKLKVTIYANYAKSDNFGENCNTFLLNKVKGNQWYDVVDAEGNIFASINPNGLDLGNVRIMAKYYKNKIPTTEHQTYLMARYFDFSSDIMNEFSHPVSIRIYYSNKEFEEYKKESKLDNITINDLNIVHYDGTNEDCQFENNDNFNLGNSVVLYKNIHADEVDDDFFYLQFEVNEFSENGATANDYTEVDFQVHQTSENFVSLSWRSKTEVKGRKYFIQRSADCVSWGNLMEVSAKGSDADYSVFDTQPLGGTSCYRLIYIDLDGTKKFLDESSFSFKGKEAKCSLFPNPAKQQAQVYIRNFQPEEVYLLDILGRKIDSEWKIDATGILQLSPSVQLTDTFYYVFIFDNKGNRCVQKMFVLED